MQRTFITGDKWLYYKLYSGAKTSDALLTDVIDPICDELISRQVIDSWFFIRYSDPKNHLRWRLRARESDDIGKIIETVFKACKSYVDSGQIYKIQTDTYKRELERYGTKTMELSETLFWHESNMIAKMLDMIEGDEGEKIRWLFGMRAIDQLLSDFEYNTQQKYDLLNMLAESFGNEFNINSSLIIKLSDKYRKEKKDIFVFMKKEEGVNHPYFPIIELLDEKSKKSKEIVEKILDINNNDLEIQLNNLLGSYIHMLLNRLFRSKQRLQEMVIYGFMFRYYRTQLAREKYNK